MPATFGAIFSHLFFFLSGPVILTVRKWSILLPSCWSESKETCFSLLTADKACLTRGNSCQLKASAFLYLGFPAAHATSIWAQEVFMWFPALLPYVILTSSFPHVVSDPSKIKSCNSSPFSPPSPFYFPNFLCHSWLRMEVKARSTFRDKHWRCERGRGRREQKKMKGTWALIVYCCPEGTQCQKF